MDNDKLEKLIILVLVMLLILCGAVAVWSVEPYIAARFVSAPPRSEVDKTLPREESRLSAAGGQAGPFPSQPAQMDAGGQAEEEDQLTEESRPEEALAEDASHQEKGVLRAGLAEGDPGQYFQAQPLEVPEAVSGRNGYQPVQGSGQQVDGEGRKKLQNELGVGETGDGLAFSDRFYPYYQMLDEKGKHLYRQIYANAQALNPAFCPIEDVSVDELKNVFLAVSNDHPELFWLDTTYACKYDEEKICMEVDLHFNRTAEDLEAAKAEFAGRAQEILAQVQGSDYEKEKQIHQMLLDQVEYRLGAEMDQSAYSALVNGQSVCAGYARAFQYLLQESGVPCYYCTGYAGEGHAWNIVGLDDGFYNVDATWDDVPGGEYNFFNKSDQDYASTHLRRELSVYLPPCNGGQYQNLEQPAGNPALRTPEEAGAAGQAACQNMQEYFADCRRQLLEAGKGNYSFANILDGEALLQEWQECYETEGYRQGYLEEAMAELGAGSCQMELEVEELQGGKYLITHRVALK